MTCGSCGKEITEANRREPYNSLCSDCPMPHMHCSAFPKGDDWERTAKGEKLWQCQFCGIEGSMEELESNECSYERHTPCKTCGQFPFCAPDCEGITKALTMPGTYLGGFEPA